MATSIAVAGACAAMASNAFAQGVEIRDSATGAPCPAVLPDNPLLEFPVDATVSGGCTTHFVNDEALLKLTAHIFGIESTDSLCSSEFTARLGSNGEGYATGVEVTGVGCTRRPCLNTSNLKEAWELHVEETTSASARIEVHLCVQSSSGGGRQTCHLFLPLREDPFGFNEYELGTAMDVEGGEIISEVGCENWSGFTAEVTGHWKTEAADIEIIHTI